MIALAETQDPSKRGRLIRRTRAYTIGNIMELVANNYGVDIADYVGFRQIAPGRETAALLCRRFTRCTLSELSNAMGLSHPDSSANLVRRAKRRESESSAYRRELRDLEQQLKTENQV